MVTFAADVSHELKSPLTAINGAAELMRDDLDGESPAMSRADRRRFLDNIIADTQRLTLIVQRLRELARAERAAIRGCAVLRAVIADVRDGYPALEIDLSGDVDEPVAMSAENARIILGHLADNALRHGTRTLTTACRCAAGVLMVRAGDDGSGISRANREKVFESFFTTWRDSGGTSMGLPIVRAMLEAHGGGIVLAADDDTGTGATFVLSIALAPRAGSRL